MCARGQISSFLIATECNRSGQLVQVNPLMTDVVPLEIKSDDGCLSLGCPSTDSGRALADTGLAYEDNQAAFSLGFFKGWPGAPLPTAHGIPFAFDGPLLRFLRDMPPSNAECVL